SMKDAITRFAPCGLVELTTDGIVVDANDTFLDWTGRSPDDVTGTPLTALIEEPADTPFDDEREGPRGSRSVAVALPHVDGSSRPVLISWQRHDDRVFVELYDATKRQQFEDRITRSFAATQRTSNRLALLLNAAVTFADAHTEVELAGALANTARLAYAATDAAVYLTDGTRVAALAGPDPFADRPEFDRLAPDALRLREVVTVSSVRQSDLPPPVVAALRNADVEGLLVAPIFHEGDHYGLLAVFFDHFRPFDEEAKPLAEALASQAGQVITGLRLQRRLHEMAMHDEITGLPNRRLLETHVERFFAAPRGALAVIFIDLDGFKAVNDELGHATGDVLLREVGERMRAVVRDDDAVVRYGGDEFVALCLVDDDDAAAVIAERLRSAIEEPFASIPRHLRISASVGIAIGGSDDDTVVADRLVRAADQAMYRAKATGGNRVVLAAGS
ncbi:MAG TPA: diguanylate cyclase, partial [Rhodoglobus sp.]|nr:diguanylate cyclase [Rhodoglobus sp.]